MAMIPIGSDGEPRFDLALPRRQEEYAPGEYLKSRWDVPYHR